MSWSPGWGHIYVSIEPAMVMVESLTLYLSDRHYCVTLSDNCDVLPLATLYANIQTNCAYQAAAQTICDKGCRYVDGIG